jgi:8-oxo-dGTP pyrophosphatase MutT (NUDIX family)
VRTTRFRTVRCIIRQGDRFLLVIHRGARAAARRWGLPGGRIEERESLEDTARREIREELGIILGPLIEVGDYRYKGARHKVLGTEYSDRIIAFHRAELRKIGWHTLEEVVALARAGNLHAGFEHHAIGDFVHQLTAQRGARE